MTDIKSMTIDELKKLMTTLGDKPFRAKQIYSWLHEHLVTSYDEMTNLSKSLREKLKEYPVTALKMVVFSCGINMEILSVFLLRWDAVWDADSVHLP